MAIYQKHNINAEIDDEMIPLVDAMNQLGLKTVACCSGHRRQRKRRAQIAFKLDGVDVLIAGNIISINWNPNGLGNRADGA